MGDGLVLVFLRDFGTMWGLQDSTPSLVRFGTGSEIADEDAFTFCSMARFLLQITRIENKLRKFRLITDSTLSYSDRSGHVSNESGSFKTRQQEQQERRISGSEEGRIHRGYEEEQGRKGQGRTIS